MNNPIAVDFTYFAQVILFLILALLIFWPIKFILNTRRRDEEASKKLDRIIELLESTEKNRKEVRK